MPVKLSMVLKDTQNTAGLSPSIIESDERLRNAKCHDSRSSRNEYTRIANLYYNPVTDFAEYARTKSFNFAPRVPAKSFQASLTPHEHHLARMLGP